MALDCSGQLLYSTNNCGPGKITVHDLQSGSSEPTKILCCNDIYNVRGIAVGEGDGKLEADIFVSGDHMVQKYSPEGCLLLSFGTCYPGSDTSHCHDPNGMHVSGRCLYVCDSMNERILVLSLDLKYVSSINNKIYGDHVMSHKDHRESHGDCVMSHDNHVKSDTEEQQDLRKLCHPLQCLCPEEMCPLHPYLKHPEHIVVDDNGNLHVVDSGKSTIAVFDSTHCFLHSIKLPIDLLPFPVSMCLLKDCYYILDYHHGHVVVVSTGGVVLKQFEMQSIEREVKGVAVLSSREAQYPLCLEVDAEGQVYVSKTVIKSGFTDSL